MNIKIRNPDEEEFLDVYNFISNCKPLENYSEHFYKIILRYFGNTCFVAELDDKIIGFIMNLVSQNDKETLFLWQIGVSLEHRNKKIGKKLLKETEKTAKEIGCKRIELTIDPENRLSQNLFQKNGYINISSKERKIIKVMGKTAVKDYYKPGRHFILYEKNL